MIDYDIHFKSEVINIEIENSYMHDLINSYSDAVV